MWLLAVVSLYALGTKVVAHHNPLCVQVRKSIFSGSGHFEFIDLVLSGRLDF